MARSLGAAGFGSYQVLLAALVTVTAVQSGWIGDSLTVLDRTDATVRGALAAAQAVFLIAGTAIAVVVALAVDGGGAVVLAFAVAQTFWLLEDTIRRLFMARMRFWGLVLNDLVYLVASLGSLGLLSRGAGPLTLADVLLSTAVGALAAVAAGRLQLPAQDFDPGRVTRAELRRVAGFAGWRSAQAGLRPLATLIVRIAVAGLAGAAALGQLQAARLLLAPVQTALAGVGSYLLPAYRREPPGTGLTAPRALVRQTVALVGAVGVATGVVLLAADALSALLFSGAVEVDHLAVAAWGAWSAAFAAGLPVMTAALVRLRSRWVFVVRSVDLAIGVLLSLLVLSVADTRWVPFAAAVGMLVAVALLWRDQRRDGSASGAAGSRSSAST